MRTKPIYSEDQQPFFAKEIGFVDYGWRCRSRSSYVFGDANSFYLRDICREESTFQLE